MVSTERHVAVVANTEDPQKRGRIQVRCAGLLGSEDAIVRRWVLPCFDWGLFIVPDKGEQVEIEVTASSDRDESHGQSFLEEPNLRYRGKRFYGSADEINEMFRSSNYGKRRGFATPGGHVVMFDDTEGGKKINFAWHGVDNEYAMLSFDEAGSIVLANKKGSMVYLNAAAGELAIIDEHGNSISTEAAGIKIIDKNSNVISMLGTTVQILSQSAVTISCKDAVIDAGKVQLAGSGATEAVIFGTTFMVDFIQWIADLMTMLGTIAPTPSGLAVFITKTAAFVGTQLPADLSTKSFTK